MIKFLKYSFFDLIRSYWTIIYTMFYGVVTFTMIYFSGDTAKSLISMMNIVVVLTPLVASIFGAIYFYNSREFIELLLAQPIKRTTIFTGQFMGLSVSLIVSFIIGVGIPFLMHGVLFTDQAGNFINLLIVGSLLSMIFSAISFSIALKNENRIKGFGLSLFLWLFMAIIYDGIILILLIWFNDYPTENLAITLTVLNPIDLSRVAIMLGLDVSALLGYTGAVFYRFFGSASGILVSISSLVAWTLIPLLLMLRIAKKKDF